MILGLLLSMQLPEFLKNRELLLICAIENEQRL